MQEPENLSQMQSELENLKSQLNQQQQENETLVKDKANLVEEIQDWVKKSNENSQEKAGIKKEMEELQHQLIEITKVCNFLFNYLFFFLEPNILPERQNTEITEQKMPKNFVKLQ